MASPPAGRQSEKFCASLTLTTKQAALVPFRVMEVAYESMDVAMAMADAFNSQHVEGFDLNGNFGSNFFSTAQPQALGNTSNNPATGLPVVTVSDVSALTVSDYRVTFDGADYTILRLSDNAVLPPPGPTSRSRTSIDVPHASTSALMATVRGAGAVPAKLIVPRIEPPFDTVVTVYPDSAAAGASGALACASAICLWISSALSMTVGVENSEKSSIPISAMASGSITDKSS